MADEHAARRRSLHPAVLLLLAAILLAGYALRLYKLGDQSVWYDEAFSAVLVRNDPATITDLTSYDVHPPLFYYLLWAWRALAGESAWTLRYLALAAGMLTLPVLFQFGKRLLDWRAGLVAALLLAVSRFHIWWSQEIRMYTLAVLFGVLALLAMLRWLIYLDGPRAALVSGRHTPQRLWLAYVLAGAASLYTVYLAALPLLAANLLILAGLVMRATGLLLRHGTPDPAMQPRWPLWRSLLWWSSAQLAILGLFAPWMLLVAGRAPNWGSASQLDSGFFAEVYLVALTMGVSTDIGNYLLPAAIVLGLIVATLFLAALPQHSKAETVTLRLGILLLLLCLCVPAAMVYLLTTVPRDRFYVPPFSVRYTVLAVPYFCALLGAGIALLVRLRFGRFIAPALVAMLVAFNTAVLPDYFAPRYASDDYWSLVRTINAFSHPRDIIVLYTEEDWPDFAYAYQHLNGTLQRVDINRGDHLTQEKVAALFSGLIQSRHNDGIWLVRRNAGAVDPGHYAEQWLEQNMHKVAEFGFTGKELLYFTTVPNRDLFTTGSDSPAIEYSYPPPDGVYAAEKLGEGALGISQPPFLIGYDLPAHEYRNQDALTIALYWSARGRQVSFDHHLDIRVQMYNEAGTLVHEEAGVLWAAALARDGNNAVARIPFTFWVAKQLPPGTYHIVVTVAQPDASKNTAPQQLVLPDGITIR